MILDSDNDGIEDDRESEVYGTDPQNPDTNGDGMTDGQASAFWADLWNEDADHDGVINLLDSDASFAHIHHQGKDRPFVEPIPAGSKSGKSYLWLETEDGDIYHPMRIKSGDTHSSGHYVQVIQNNGYHYYLTAGSHTLIFRCHKLSPRLDQLLITDDPRFFNAD